MCGKLPGMYNYILDGLYPSVKFILVLDFSINYNLPQIRDDHFKLQFCLSFCLTSLTNNFLSFYLPSSLKYMVRLLTYSSFTIHSFPLTPLFLFPYLSGIQGHVYCHLIWQAGHMIFTPLGLLIGHFFWSQEAS